jgi:hypothetical protein
MLSPDEEGGELAGGVLPVGVDVGDVSAGGALVEEGEEAGEGGLVSFGDDADGAVVFVADPAGEA